MMKESLETPKQDHADTRKHLAAPNRDGIVGPNVGEPWPELHPEAVSWPDTSGFHLHLHSTTDGTKTSRLLRLGFHFDARVIAVALLTVIAVYAMRHHDSELLRTIVHAVEGDSRIHAASKSPP
jgi:hypothetical protein